MRLDFTKQIEQRHKANKLVYSTLFGAALMVAINDMSGIQMLLFAI